jgi:hypothetical protein
MIDFLQSAWVVQHPWTAFAAAVIVTVGTAVAVIRDLRQRSRR